MLCWQVCRQRDPLTWICKMKDCDLTLWWLHQHNIYRQLLVRFVWFVWCEISQYIWGRLFKQLCVGRVDMNTSHHSQFYNDIPTRLTDGSARLDTSNILCVDLVSTAVRSSQTCLTLTPRCMSSPTPRAWSATREWSVGAVAQPVAKRSTSKTCSAWPLVAAVRSCRVQTRWIRYHDTSAVSLRWSHCITPVTRRVTAHALNGSTQVGTARWLVTWEVWDRSYTQVLLYA